jgi:integrase-like protein
VPVPGDAASAFAPSSPAGKHGTWAFAVDLPSITGRRHTLRRSSFPTRASAQAELNRILACERTGITIDDHQTVADWLATKALTLKPTTTAHYTDYLTKDLIPALGEIRLKKLSHQHVAQFVRIQLDAGRGPITLRRRVATLSSALNNAVRQRRLTHNAAIPKPVRPQRICWTPEAVTFLQLCAEINDPPNRTVRSPHRHRHTQRRSLRPATTSTSTTESRTPAKHCPM